MTTTININVLNFITNQHEIVSQVEVSDYSYEVMAANAKTISDFFPDCGVTFSESNGDFVSLMPVNMRKDEEPGGLAETDFKAFIDKWYSLEVKPQQEIDPMTEALIEAEEDRDFMARITAFNY